MMPPLVGKVITIVGWLIIGPLLVIALCRIVAHDATMILIWLNAATLYLYVPAYVVGLLAGVRRNWPLLTASAFLVVCHLVWVLPDLSLWSPQTMPLENDSHFRLFSANLLMVNPTPQPIIEEIKDAKADVLLLQEFSPVWQEAFVNAGVFDAYPDREGIVREDSFGTAIMSQRPLTDAEVWDVAGLPMTRGKVRVAGQDVQIVNVHTLPPRLPTYTKVWRQQMEILVETVMSSKGPLVLMGDFNATQHSALWRRLAATRLRDCHRDRGRGFATTFPNGLFPLPSMRLDHVFVSPEIACLEIKEGEGWNSDHRPVIVDLALAKADERHSSNQ